MSPTTSEWMELRPEAFGSTTGTEDFTAALRAKNAATVLSRSAAPRRENWSWPARTPSMPASGGSEPVRAAFFRFLDTGEPYCTEEK